MNNKTTIFVGITTDNELYFLNIEQPTEDHNYFSISGDTYSLIEAEQGEQEAKDGLEDGELWKMAVEGDRTTLSLTDWIELVIDTDGWESMFDFNYDYSPITYDGREYYLNSQSGGQNKVPLSDIKHFAIPQHDYAELLRIWNAYHLKKETPKTPAIIQNIDEELQKALQLLDNDNELIR
jgi:hypothetical protein